MPTARVQQRGAGVAAGNDLQQQIHALQLALGMRGVTPTSYFNVTDNTGIQRVQVGVLNNGDYGILLRDPLGNAEELLCSVDAFYEGSLSTSSETPVSITNSPSVTCWVGASGNVRISASSQVDISGANSTATAVLTVDGNTIPVTVLEVPFAIFYVGTSASNLTLGTSGVASYYAITGGLTLSPGEHTFGLQYASLTGTTASFSLNYLLVEPL